MRQDLNRSQQENREWKLKISNEEAARSNDVR